MDTEDKRQLYLDAFMAALPEEYQMAFGFGPAHIVVDDGNLFDEHITFCMQEIESYLKLPKEIHKQLPAFHKWSTGKCIEVMGKIYVLLEALLEIPDD